MGRRKVFREESEAANIDSPVRAWCQAPGCYRGVKGKHKMLHVLPEHSQSVGRQVRANNCSLVH